MNHQPNALEQYIDHHVSNVTRVLTYCLVTLAVCYTPITRGTTSLATLGAPVATPQPDAGQTIDVAPTPVVPAAVTPPAPVWAPKVPRISTALMNYSPKYVTSIDQAMLHANAALAAEAATGVDSTLLLALAWVESRYNPNTLSYMDCSSKPCKRKTANWNSVTPPHGARSTWYCGATQVGGDVPWTRCQALREDTVLSYTVGAEHLIWWSKQTPCRRLSGANKWNCAIRGYNGGYDRDDLEKKKEYEKAGLKVDFVVRIANTKATRWYLSQVCAREKDLNHALEQLN